MIRAVCVMFCMGGVGGLAVVFTVSLTYFIHCLSCCVQYYVSTTCYIFI
jgi:hypothetical protein